MALLDTLQQILANATNPNPQHVDQLSREAPKDQLGAGVADALRSDQTPELGDTLSNLFANASPQDRADILNMLTEKFGAEPDLTARKISLFSNPKAFPQVAEGVVTQGSRSRLETKAM